MMDRKTETSPQTYARATGLLYLVVIAAGMFAQMFVADRIVVHGDAAATAANILAHRSLFQLGFTIYLIEMAAQTAMIGFLYFLLNPVSRSISLVALCFGLTGCIVKTLSRLFYISPLLVLGDTGYLSAFGAEQSQALALLLLRVNDQAAGIALPFFGLSTLLNGSLIFKSTFLPRFLGLVSILGGLGWLTFLDPALGSRLFPYILVIGVLGSVLQILWLLVKGVNVERWNERALANA